MSFGWSAGDIATAATLVYNLIEALDSCDGAAGEYREAVGFLRDLKRTLDPLQTFTAWSAYPDYGNELKEQVALIREPIEFFLASIVKYEPSLGAKAAAGRHRHVLRKVQWYLFMTKRVLGLRKKIASHIQVIEMLLQRLTVDMAYKTQTELPQNLRTIFNETIRPDLIAFLRENLVPLDKHLIAEWKEYQDIQQDNLISRLSADHRDMSSDIGAIRELLETPHILQEQIASAMRRPNRSPKLRIDYHSGIATPKHDEDQEDNKSAPLCAKKSIREVYYMVFLYLGHFLGNLFLALSRLVQPSRALMPTLLAKYNISFLDAIGRPPRILPYEFFRNIKVLRAFIEHEFMDLPGSSWVKRGDYVLLGSVSNYALNVQNWNRAVVPGSRVTMSIVSNVAVEHGEDQRLRAGQRGQLSFAKSIVINLFPETENSPNCQKEVYTSINALVSNNIDSDSDSDSDDDQKAYQHPTRQGERRTDLMISDQDEISLLKRVTQEITRASSPPPSKPKPKGILRQPREKFPEDSVATREDVHPSRLQGTSGIPPDARWTKIDRRLVSPEALYAGGEIYDASEDYVIVLRVLTKKEVHAYAIATQQIRAAHEKVKEVKLRKPGQKRAEKERRGLRKDRNLCSESDSTPDDKLSQKPIEGQRPTPGA